MSSAVKVFTSGQRVKYIGITGRADGLTGRVIRQYRGGVLVRWSDGSRYAVHPQDILAVPADATQTDAPAVSGGAR